MNHRPKIIAEIGWNHMGDMELAKQMIDAAKESGADFAKFQSWSVRRLKPGEWDEDGRRQIYEKAELTPERHEELIDYCKRVGIGFLTSVCSLPDAELVASYGLKTVKVPSLDCRNLELIQFCLNHFEEVIVSTGTSTLEEVKALVVLEGAEERLILMHCVSSYPCLPENANLPKIGVLKGLHSRVGYSDHTQGVLCSVLALEYEPLFLEKHFTTDKELPGRDNQFAILPQELAALRKAVDTRELAMKAHGEDFLPIEEAARKNYSGRFDKKD